MPQHKNDVSLLGNLTRDPELRYTPNNTAVCDFGLAVNNEYTQNDDDTLFIDVTCWKTLAENCSEYLDTGSPVLLDGRLTLDQWKDDDGNKHSKIGVTAESVSFLHSGESSESDGPGVVDDKVGVDEVDETEDDIPF